MFSHWRNDFREVWKGERSVDVRDIWGKVGEKGGTEYRVWGMGFQPGGLRMEEEEDSTPGVEIRYTGWKRGKSSGGKETEYSLLEFLVSSYLFPLPF